MNNQIRFHIHHIILIILLFGMVGCLVQNEVQRKKPKNRKNEFLIKKLTETTSTPQWLYAKINCDVKHGEDVQSFKINMRLRYDSAIYLTFSKVGIIGSKVLLTNDSITYLQKVNDKYYIRESYDYINDLLGTELTLCTIQNLIFANPEGFDEEEKYKAKTDDFLYYISTLRPKRAEKTIDKLKKKLIVYQYWLYPENYQLAKLVMNNLIDTTTLIMNYNNYVGVQEIYFPLDQNLSLSKSADTVLINMSYSKIIMNEPQVIKLTIPSNYERR